MPLDTSFQITPAELAEIYSRIEAYYPPQLTKIEPNPSGWGLRYEFKAFTGREAEPNKPRASYDDPRLSYVTEDEDKAEHLLRLKAEHVLGDLYDAARAQWKIAAYVRDLKSVIGDAPQRWKTYQHESKALAAAYDYLRTPEAAREWPAALSRLIDAQDRTKAAAAAFDARAERIASVHDKHLYAELSHNEALEAAGIPEARNWHIADACDYGKSHYYGDWDTYLPLEEQVRRLVERQDAHVAKVGRLSGTAG